MAASLLVTPQGAVLPECKRWHELARSLRSKEIELKEDKMIVS
jgi:hypothetical protein